jgi:DNA-binding SARP family transcriptional activator
MRLTATVLGDVQVLADESVVDLGGARQRRLLAALLVHRGRAVATDDLVEATFGGDPPDAAWRTFRTYVARLRRALDAEGLDGSAVILTVPSGYATCADLALDADHFEALLRSAQDDLDAGEPVTALTTVEEALALWAGPAYGEFAGDDWARPDAVRLEELRLVAREVRAAAMVESGRHDEAIAEIQGLIEVAPLREEPRRLVMLGLYRSGRHAEALRAGRDFRAALADETGLEWSNRLAELEQMIIDRDPRLDAAPRGRKLRGYVLGEVLADSDHGVTYRASQPAVGRDVAITVIPPELADGT